MTLTGGRLERIVNRARGDTRPGDGVRQDDLLGLGRELTAT